MAGDETAQRYFADDETLGAARRWLREEAKGTGALCPCCRQNAKIYRRGINAGQAATLIAAYRRAARADFKLSTTVPTAGGDYAKLRYWGLIEDLREVREDGGKAGWWRITDLGEAWVRGKLGVPRYVYVYDNQRLRFDTDAEQDWTVRDALGDRFDYDELWSAPGLMEPPL